MAACFWSPISFPPVLMTEMGEFGLFHWGTTHCIATFGTQTAIRIKCPPLLFFFIRQANFLYFVFHFISWWNVSHVSETCWKRCQIPYASGAFRLGSVIWNDWKCTEHCYKSGSFLVQSGVVLRVDWVGRMISHQALTGKVLVYISRYCILLANTLFREVYNQALCLLFCSSNLSDTTCLFRRVGKLV